MNPPSQNDEIVIGPREQLFHLLAEAAEIEHTLMCSYLYLCFSLKVGTASGLSANEAAAVERWRDSIRGIAIDEMAHLLIVANLSIAIGGRPHFGRPNFPVAPGYFPSGVIVRLTPFSAEMLDHVIFLERPRGVSGEDGAGFEPDASYRREEAYHGLMPSVQDYATVGDLYEALRANLTASASRLGEAGLFVGSVSAQVSGETVDVASVATITTLEEALAAVDTIIEQGEGSPDDRADSHYQRFREIRREYDDLRIANPAFEPAWPAASNPVMRRPIEPQDKVFIDHPGTAQILDLANAVYSLLLRLLVQLFGRQTSDAAQIQRRYLDAAVHLMRVLGRTGSLLATLPASDSAPGVNAGMTFTMLRGVEPLLVGMAERHLVEERLQEIQDAAQRVAATNRDFAGAVAALAAARVALGYATPRATSNAAQPC